jgi:hypothetical protein
MISTATAIVLTLLLAWAAVTAVMVSLTTLGRRRARRGEVVLDLTVREGQEETRWAAVRLLGHGISGEQLQEAVCQATNCTPAEASLAIAAARGRRIDEPPRS